MARTSELIRGLGTAVRLITLLIEEVKKQGGSESMIVALTKDARRVNLETVARVIVSLPWREPVTKSEMIRLARQASVKEYEDDYADNDAQLFWQPVLIQLDIPYVRFSNEDEETSIPEGVAEELHGKIATSGICVEWDGKEYVVVSIGLKRGEATVGQAIDKTTLEFVHLALTHYFDLNN